MLPKRGHSGKKTHSYSQEDGNTSQSTETYIPHGSNVMKKEGGACSYEPHGVGEGVVGWGVS